MLEWYPALFLLIPYLSGLVLGPAVLMGWIAKAALTCPSAPSLDAGLAVKGLVPIVMAAAGSLLHMTAPVPPEQDGLVWIEGVVRNGPWPRSGYARGEEIRLVMRNGPQRGSCTVSTSEAAGTVSPILGPADRVRIRGRVRSWKGNWSIQTREELIERTGVEWSHFPLRWIYKLRRTLWRGLDNSLEKEAASLAGAMLFGISSGLEHHVKDAFRRTGTAHLLSISGLHTGLITLMMIAVAARLGLSERHRFWPMVAGLAAFCLVTGWRIPVLRACLVCTFYLYGSRRNRYQDPLNPLFNACLIILLIQPMALFEVSFQLSFAGYGSIILFLKGRSLLHRSRQARDRMVPGREKTPLWRTMGRKVLFFLGVSTASWTGTLPLVIYYFQYFNPLTPLINLLVFPFFVASVTASAVHATTLLMGLNQSLLTVWPVEACIGSMVQILDLSRTLPPGTLDVPAPSSKVVLVVYLVVIVGFAYISNSYGYKGKRNSYNYGMVTQKGISYKKRCIPIITLHRE